MEVINEALQNYSEKHTSQESDLLASINRETHAKVLMPRMLSGHLQGRMLAMISNMIKPTHVLEIGTYTGYSAICLCEGIREGGKLVTLDINEELENNERNNFSKAGLSNVIDYRIGNAVDIIPQLAMTFDLVFIDADKENYSNYFNMIIDKVNLGGFIMADNVLWSGKVLDTKQDKDTRAIVSFNDKINKDSRVENVLLPVRDGIMLMRKVSL
jgi:predicted O-methyltransferase YrrM